MKTIEKTTEIKLNIQEEYNTLNNDLNEYNKIGENIWISKTAKIAPTAFVSGPTIIGNNTEINMNCTFLDDNKIIIGKNGLIAPNVQIYTAFHPTNDIERFGLPKEDGTFEYLIKNKYLEF